MSSKLFIWKLEEVLLRNGENSCVYVKDDEQAFNKIKGIIGDYILADIEDCESKLYEFSEDSGDFEYLSDWVESLQNRYNEIVNYTSISQFKTTELYHSEIYINKVEVI